MATFDSVEKFNTFWQKTNRAKQDFDQRHQRGCGLWLNKYQASAVEVQNFMDDFSPIIDIVQAFGTPYGGLAVGTISILFIVGPTRPIAHGSQVTATAGRSKQGQIRRGPSICHLYNYRSIGRTTIVQAYLQ